MPKEAVADRWNFLAFVEELNKKNKPLYTTRESNRILDEASRKYGPAIKSLANK